MRFARDSALACLNILRQTERGHDYPPDMKRACSTPLALLLGISIQVSPAAAESSEQVRRKVVDRVDAEYPSLFSIYTNLHRHPELSFMEVKTAALVAKELRAAGFAVTEKVGKTGVVGVLANGPGPTILLRADMDGLPIKENSGVPYASTDVVKDISGEDQPAMHGCAHDTHVTGLIGAARVLAKMKEQWSGTLILIAQPAEEIGAGARAMLTEGLYKRFPRPDYAIALHTASGVPAGEIRYGEGPYYASVNSVDIVVRGIGGHGARPHTTKDPVVLAAEIVLALQTIVSREIKPGDPAVITVGTIHGGLKRNVISDEVKLELTIRAFDEKVMNHMVSSIRRICAGLAQAAGLPADRYPVVTLTPESIPVTSNDPPLTRRLVGAFNVWFGADRVKMQPPATGGEDFSEYGRTSPPVPICIWTVGGGDPVKIAEAERNGTSVPSNHSATFAPIPEPTLKACVTSMAAAVVELMGKTEQTTKDESLTPGSRPASAR
jgi:hippurate hydrolase